MNPSENNRQEKITDKIGSFINNRNLRRNNTTVSVIIFMLIGLAVTIVGIVILINTLAFVEQAKEADAIVVEISRFTNTDGYLEFIPHLEYTSDKGGTVEFDWFAESEPSYDTGEIVPILYDPENPSDIKINDFGNVWLLPVIVISMGLFWELINVFAVLLPFLRRRKDDQLVEEGRVSEQEIELKNAFKSSKVNTIMGVIFLIDAIGMLTGGYFTYRNTEHFLSVAKSVTGIVISMEKHTDSDSSSVSYSPVIEFIPDSEQSVIFSSSSSSSDPDYLIGDEVAVLYDPADPEKARINSEFEIWGLSVILTSIGAVFLLISAMIFGIPLMRKRRHQRLIENGMAIDANVVDVRMNPHVTVTSGGSIRHPYRIIAEWQNPRNGEFVEFRSENIWFNPESYVGKTVRVYVHPEKSKTYYMDTTFLPKDGNR